jgi:HEAT repeat protein
MDIETPLNPRYLYRLSDLESPELEQLQAAWPKIPAWRRQALLEDVEELNENDMLLSFESLGRFALQDDDAKVRLLAVHILWEFEENNLIPIFIRLMTTDSDSEVRAASASALGRFVYAGELEEISHPTLKNIEDVLLATVNGSDAPEVRRSALESLGYSSRDEVTTLVEKAFASDDKYWKASSLFAMGRSANQRWTPTVLAMLNSNLR